MGPNVPVDPSTGLGPYEWAAKYVNDLFHLGRYAGTSAAPSLDGFFLDDVMIDPSNGGGKWPTATGKGSVRPRLTTRPARINAVMAGEKSFYSYLIPPGPEASNWVIGRHFGAAASKLLRRTDRDSQQSDHGGHLHAQRRRCRAATIEHAMGKSSPIETWGGSAAMQARYRTAMNNFGGAKLMLFSHERAGQRQRPGDVQLRGTPASWSPAWQGMRYGMTAALMNNGYYFADGGAYDEETAANRRWFDEYDNAGAGVGYLGQPVGGSLGNPQTGAWSNGVWMREFYKGVVLWNPKGNGARTVNVAGLVSRTVTPVSGTSPANRIRPSITVGR